MEFTNEGYPNPLLAETIKNGFFSVDGTWKVTLWNNAAEKLLGRNADSIVGRNIWDEFSGLIPMQIFELYHQSSIKDIPVHIEEFWREKGVWFDVFTYYDEDTLSVSFKSTNHDVHQEIFNEELKIRNELYRFVSEVTGECLWEWDLLTMELFWIDGAHKKAFGYPIENALIPRSFWTTRIHPDDRTRVLAKLKDFTLGQNISVWEDEYRFEKADGGYAYVLDRGRLVFDKDKKATRMIGSTQDITSKKMAEIQLLESEKHLWSERLTRQKELTSAVLLAQENERIEIGQELHDNLNQTLVASKMFIEMAKRNGRGRKMLLDKSSGYIMDVIESVRKISKVLAAPGLHIIGIVESIKNLVNDLSMTSPITIEFKEDGIDRKQLNERMERDIFRIVQEQMTNILKHAKASSATIDLTRQADELCLAISDNGKGCDILKEKDGIGLINIRHRAEFYSGRVTISSDPGHGFTLKVVLPVKSGAQALNA